MKKSRLVLLTLMTPLLINHPVSAQEANLEERVSVLESQMQEVLKQQAPSRSNESIALGDESPQAQTTADGVRIVQDLPQNLEEGWEFACKNHSSFNFITIANMRYNDQFLFLDVSLKDSTLSDLKLINNLQRYFTIAQIGTDVTNINQEHLLKLQLQQIPTELEGQLPLLKATDITPSIGESMNLTFPFKLNQPIEKASKIYMEFGDEQSVEFELVSDSTVI